MDVSAVSRQLRRTKQAIMMELSGVRDPSG